MLFVGLGLALGGQRRLERLAGSACALLSAAALLVTLSRGAWVGALAASILLLALSPRARRIVPLVVASTAGVLLTVLALAAPQLLQVLVSRAAALVDLDANPEDARPLIYQEAVRQIVERPWTGQGPGNYTVVMESADSAAPTVAVLHAHNVLLHVAAEAGLPAAVVLVAFTLSVARAVLLARRWLPEPDRDVLTGLAAGLVAVMSQGVMDFTLGNPTLLFLVWMVVGFVLAATVRPQATWVPSSADRLRSAGVTVPSPALRSST
nr:O-antigen ligase family protein [Blastococcus saxobsidens]